MTEIGVVAYQMTRLDERNTLVLFSVLLLKLFMSFIDYFLEDGSRIFNVFLI